MQQTQTYKERSRIFLAKARDELAAGDLEQASEKAWGAASLMLKAAAQQRGLDHETHNQLFQVLRVVASELDDQELRRLFNDANGLHHNFYEHRLTAEEISDDIDSVERFVGKVESFLA